MDNRGETLVELTVVLAIIGVVSLVGFRVLGFERTNRFDGVVQQTLSDLRDLQSNARTVENNKEYGMTFSSATVTTFSRDPATGTETAIKTISLTPSSLATSITPSGGSKITFQRLTGLPTGNADTTLTFSLSNPTRSKIIRIEPSGVIYVQ